MEEYKVTKQYIFSRVELVKKYLADRNYEKTVEELKEALIYPKNLGEGKLAGAQKNMKKIIDMDVIIRAH